MEKSFEKTIQVPEGVEAAVKNNDVKFRAGDKTVSKKFVAREIAIKLEGDKIIIVSKNAKKKTTAIVNAIASQISNLFAGLKKEFEYRLEIVYSHFPMNVAVREGFVEINNLGGAKMPKKARIVENTKVVVKGKDVTVTSSNKEHAGQTAANLETASKIRGKDKRIFQDGIYIVSKPKELLGAGND